MLYLVIFHTEQGGIFLEYIIHYDICAIILCICTAVIFCIRKRVPCIANKLFGLLLCITSLSSVFDLLSVTADISWGWRTLNFLNIAYYITQNLIPITFLTYFLCYTDILQHSDTKYKIMVYLPEIINLSFIITSPLTKLIVYVDKAGNYIRGPLQPLCYVITIYYMVFTIIFAFRNRRKVSAQTTACMILFVGIVFIAVITQMLNPHILVECFSCSLCLLLIMFTLQNQDDMLDSTTKMLNRSTFINNCALKFHSNEPFSILLIRIPDFSILLKSFGIHMTKSLLFRFANYLSSYVRLDEGYYLEDDCFALTFSKQSDVKKIQFICDKINEKLKSTYRIGTIDTILSACFFRMDCPKDVDNIESTMDYIEQFKHTESKNGQIIRISDLDIYDRKRKSEIRKAIDKAIENNSFRVYYQPIYSKNEGRIISCEALVRLFDNKLGFIPPDEFIPVSEETGQILKIGKFVFEEVCRFLHKGTAKKYGIKYIQVNLSVIQCMQSDLVKEFTEIMNKYDVSPSDICLEITETASAYTPHVMENNIRAFSDMGIRFALDDFGTGYCNVSYLVNYPFKFIKLEKEIVWASFESEKAHIAIESLVAMVDKLKMNIVAEGVETSDQLDTLLNMGCNFIQGYYFSKPVPEKDFLEIIEKQNLVMDETH